MGAALLGVALGGQSWWQWQGVWPGIVVNVGTAFLLAAVLFLFERRFTHPFTARQRCRKRLRNPESCKDVQSSFGGSGFRLS
jgi:hypothetical protein